MQIKQLKLFCFQKSKQTCIRKICNFTGYTDHINKERREVAYTCRDSSGQLIPTFQSVAVAELRIKGRLEHLQVWATILFLYFLFI